MAGKSRRGQPATDEGEERTEQKPPRPMRASQCRTYMRKALVKHFPEIVDGFVEGAKAGSCAHVKLATEFLEPKARVKQVKQGQRTLDRWIEEMERGI